MPGSLGVSWRFKLTSHAGAASPLFTKLAPRSLKHCFYGCVLGSCDSRWSPFCPSLMELSPAFWTWPCNPQWLETELKDRTGMFVNQVIFFNIYFYLCVCVCHISEDALRGQKRVLDTLEAQLQVVVSHLTRVLGSKLGSFTRTLCMFNSQVIQFSGLV